MLQTISILVTGKVQGVWFRKYTCDKATALGINGFVKNMPDDSVYILATGTAAQLQAFVEWCHKGSPKSRVEKVMVADEPLTVFSNFNIHQ
jgi:acylphosphatase